MNPTILHFSRTGNAMKMLLFLGFAVLAFGLAYLLLEERQAVAPLTQTLPGGLVLPMPAPRPDPFAPVKIPLLLAAGGVSLFYVGRHGVRLMTREVAVTIATGQLHFHPSYNMLSSIMPIANVTEAIFDRAERLPEGKWESVASAVSWSANRSARSGAMLRHGLYLRYRSGASTGEVRLIDNDFDGGAEQLRRFAAQIEMWRGSRPPGHR